jgi:hypothetical protein
MALTRLSGLLEKSSAWPISTQFSSSAIMIHAPNCLSNAAGGEKPHSREIIADLVFPR